MHILTEPGYEYAEWKVARVGVDYHVEVGAHYYLVPCQHVRAQVAARVTRTTVEVSQCSQRIASRPVRLPGPPWWPRTCRRARRDMAGWNA